MNSYENAHKGVSKVFTSQILDIVSTVCFVIGLIAIVVTGVGAIMGSDGAMAGGIIAVIVFMIAALVLQIVAFILKIVGCAKAGKDNASFHNAFLFSIAGIILTVAYGIITALTASSGIVDDIIKIILDLCKMFVLIYIIQGCAELAAEKGDEVVANKAKTVLYTIVILLLISLACSFVGTAFVGTFAAVVSIVLVLAYVIGNIVAYILFIILLGKTKKMLA